MVKSYSCVEEDKTAIEKDRQVKGKFVLAINIQKSDNPSLRIADFLRHCKNQQKVERGLRFLKSNEFLADSVFLKKQSRIVALSMNFRKIYIHQMEQLKLKFSI